MKVYKQWVTQSGNPIKVEPLEFIDYVRKDLLIRKITYKKVVYVGEIWRVLHNGKEIEVRIRVEYDPNLFESNENLSSDIKDLWFNPLVDTYKYCATRINSKLGAYIPKSLNKNSVLDKLEEKDKQYIEILKRVKKYISKKENKELFNFLKLKISFNQSPDFIKFKKIQRLDKKYGFQTQINNIIQQNQLR